MSLLTALVTKFVEFRPVPPKIIPILFFIMIISVVLLLFTMQYFPSLQKNIYSGENDLLFPVSAAYIFPMTFIIAFMLVCDVLLNQLLRIPKIKKMLIIYEELPVSKRERIFSEMMRKRYLVFELIVLFICIFFSFITLPVHLRLNDAGIFYTKIFSFKEKYYEWDKLESVSIYSNEQDSSLRVSLTLEFGGHRVSVDGDKGLIPPHFREVLSAVDLIKQNTNIITGVFP